jgi:hypothetical protein
VVAEDVEDHATWQQLDALGGDAIQGYNVSRPVAPTTPHLALTPAGGNARPAAPALNAGSPATPAEQATCNLSSTSPRSALASEDPCACHAELTAYKLLVKGIPPAR